MGLVSFPELFAVKQSEIILNILQQTGEMTATLMLVKNTANKDYRGLEMGVPSETPKEGRFLKLHLKFRR
jgi:hypothetical protein